MDPPDPEQWNLAMVIHQIQFFPHIKDSCQFDGLTDVYSNWHMGRWEKNFQSTNANLSIN
jgi:hypothetical protein